MNATHTAQTDTKNKIKLESSIIYAEWLSPAAVAGYTAELEVVTSMVGEGAAIEIKGKSSKGKAPDSIKGTIHGNYFAGSLPIPEKVDPAAEIWFEAKLSKHGLKMESLSYTPDFGHSKNQTYFSSVFLEVFLWDLLVRSMTGRLSESLYS